LRVHWTGLAYVPLVLLHASVALRVVTDMLEWIELRAGSSVLTIVALASYGAALGWASWRRKVPRPNGPAAAG
jgi:hypothetical protein